QKNSNFHRSSICWVHRKLHAFLLQTGDFENLNAVQAEWIRSVGRSRIKDAGERDICIPPWMQSEHVTPGLMKPGDHDDFLSDRYALQPFGNGRRQVEPCVGTPSLPNLGASPRF